MSPSPVSSKPSTSARPREQRLTEADLAALGPLLLTGHTSAEVASQRLLGLSKSPFSFNRVYTVFSGVYTAAIEVRSMADTATDYLARRGFVADFPKHGFYVIGPANTFDLTNFRTIATAQFTSQTDWAAYPEIEISTDPSAGSPPKGYTWQRRLQQLRDWRGDPNQGEVERLALRALAIAEDLCVYAEQRFDQRKVRVTTVLTPLTDGGVQVEWTVRSTSAHHLEIEVPANARDQVALLRTRENPGGAIEEAYELINAPIARAMDEIEKLGEYAQRVAASTGIPK